MYICLCKIMGCVDRGGEKTYNGGSVVGESPLLGGVVQVFCPDRAKGLDGENQPIRDELTAAGHGR